LRKPHLLILLLFMIFNVMNVSAQEDGGVTLSSKAANDAYYLIGLGLGAEWNMNSREMFAGGALLNFDFNLPMAPIAVGVTGTVSSNFGEGLVVESSALFRWYFLGKKWSGFFAQADIGAVFIFEEDETKPMFMGGLKAGYRFPLGMFYVEPYGRVGYPFMFGIGVLAGIRIGGEK